MTDRFAQAIEDIFSVPEFKEYFTGSNGVLVPCIRYALDYNPALGEFGMENDATFMLSCRVCDYTPRKLQTLQYKGVAYVVTGAEQDAHGLTWNIRLRSKNAG